MQRLVSLVLIGLVLILVPGGARAQSYTVSISGQPDLGTVVTGSGNSTFDISTSGTITRVSGTATASASVTTAPVVTVSCSGSTSGCRNANVNVVIAATGTPTRRAGSLTNFTVTMGSAVLVTAPSGTNPVSFTIQPVPAGSSRSFTVGFDFPIFGDTSGLGTGFSSSSFSVTASPANSSSGTGTASGSAQATVIRNIALSSTASLNFGRLTLPNTGTSTVSLNRTTGAVTIGGTGAGAQAFASPAPSAAVFSITGEGGRAFSISVPSTFTLNGPSGSTPLTVTTSPSATGSQALSGTIGSAGSFELRVGGSFSMSATTAGGAYSGTVAVTVQYN